MYGWLALHNGRLIAGLPFHKRKAFYKQLVIPQDPVMPPFTKPKSHIPELPRTQPQPPLQPLQPAHTNHLSKADSYSSNAGTVK